MANVLLTKSKYLIGLQCASHLWTVFNDKDSIEPPTVAEQQRFDEGTLVGELAQKVFPKGISVPFENFMDNIKQTKELLKKRKVLFEPGIMTGDLFSRADILKPVGKDKWDIIEVKGGTSVKDINVHDVSFQKYCYEQAGLKIRNCYLMHLNNEYVKQGEIDPKELFVIEDIGKLVEEAIVGIKDRIEYIFEIISLDNCPEFDVTEINTCVYSNPKLEEFYASLPDTNVFELYRAGSQKIELYQNGITHIKDIDDNFKLTTNQQIQKKCAITGKPHVDKDKIKEFLSKFEYPINYLDFETFSTGIPIFDGTKPYQQIPFQFSLHIEDKKGEVKHHEFLAEGQEDPRLKFIESLRKSLSKKGTILAYNQGFEIGRLKEIALTYPEHADFIEEIIPRFLDLLVPFRGFYYYNSTQKGSASIKKVLPAITKTNDYETLEINNGELANLMYMNIMTGKITDPTEIKKIHKDLLEYCKLDTWAEVLILRKLKGLIKL